MSAGIPAWDAAAAHRAGTGVRDHGGVGHGRAQRFVFVVEYVQNPESGRHSWNALPMGVTVS